MFLGDVKISALNAVHYKLGTVFMLQVRPEQLVQSNKVILTVKNWIPVSNVLGDRKKMIWVLC